MPFVLILYNHYSISILCNWSPKIHYSSWIKRWCKELCWYQRIPEVQLFHIAYVMSTCADFVWVCVCVICLINALNCCCSLPNLFTCDCVDPYTCSFCVYIICVWVNFQVGKSQVCWKHDSDIRWLHMKAICTHKRKSTKFNVWIHDCAHFIFSLYIYICILGYALMAVLCQCE